MHKYIRKVKRNFVPQSTCVLKMCTILIITEIFLMLFSENYTKKYIYYSKYTYKKSTMKF